MNGTTSVRHTELKKHRSPLTTHHLKALITSNRLTQRLCGCLPTRHRRDRPIRGRLLEAAARACHQHMQIQPGSRYLLPASEVSHRQPLPPELHTVISQVWRRGYTPPRQGLKLRLSAVMLHIKRAARILTSGCLLPLFHFPYV